MKAGNLKTSTLLVWGFILTVLVIFIFASFAVYEARELTRIANKMYNHPLTVSNALRDIKANINAIHRSMKDVVLAKTPEQMNNTIKIVNMNEQQVFQYFALVEERFLGDKKHVLSVLKDFESWKPIRNEVIELVKKGKRDEAIAITTGKGRKHINLINSGSDGKAGLNYLMNFANTKANEFQKLAQLKGKSAFTEITIILASAMILTLFIILLLRQSLEATKELQESEERLRLSQRLANIGSWDWNIVTGQLRWSDTVKQIFGFAEHVFPESYDAFLQSIHQEDRAFVIDSLDECIKQKKDYAVEHRIITPDGKLRWVSETGNVLFDQNGNAVRMLGMARDITERKEAEKKIETYLADLERSNKDLEDFASIASHDLQEPLRAIAGFLQLINKKYGHNIDEQGKDYLRRSINAAIRQQGMINNLLSYARITTKGLPFTDCNVGDIFKNVLENLHAKIEKSNAEITYEALPQITADKLQIERVFQNLIDNSLKFCDSKSPTIHVACKQQHGCYEFSVRDNGIGIEPQYNERIFNIFERLHGREKYDGSGLGLAACKKIIDRHGGRIWLESEPGEGTTFYFILPMREGV